ncbi:DUF177 domain-containing protein [uncultured Cohaesibacter sp.]|uniref:YceD family protein n=1 Tax=uncultured Cohaesibacter sp. TaxID=1002546 RepID=UPI00292F47F6|nr:DUF177 domain-containing protein [uncultured Cohaesibacter sp.]
MAKKIVTEEIIELEPVLSLPIAVDRLKSLGEMVKAEADEEACDALRERLGILAVKSFSVEAKVMPWKKRGVRIEGAVRGEVEQACVVTLQPVLEMIDAELNLTLVPKGSSFARRADNNLTGGEMVVDPEGEDPPEEFEGEEIDIGKYAEEFFALNLNDYPRVADAEFSPHIEDESGSDSSENPFAALASLKKDLPEKE